MLTIRLMLLTKFHAVGDNSPLYAELDSTFCSPLICVLSAWSVLIFASSLWLVLGFLLSFWIAEVGLGFLFLFSIIVATYTITAHMLRHMLMVSGMSPQTICYHAVSLWHVTVLLSSGTGLCRDIEPNLRRAAPCSGSWQHP